MLRTLTSEQKAELVEELGSLEHEQWAHWMHYLLSVITPEIRKCFGDNLIGWERQMMTHYSHLSEKEKESDRVWARKVLQKIEELNMEILTK